jgi:hypothetical protein
MAFACSHLPYPLGIGLPYGRLRRLHRPPMGLTVFHPRESQTPSGHPLPRWASVLSRGRLQSGPSCPHPILVRASQPLWPVRLHEVWRGSPWYPERSSSRPTSRCGSQAPVLFCTLRTSPLPGTHGSDEERRTGSPRPYRPLHAGDFHVAPGGSRLQAFVRLGAPPRAGGGVFPGLACPRVFLLSPAPPSGAVHWRTPPLPHP